MLFPLIELERIAFHGPNTAYSDERVALVKNAQPPTTLSFDVPTTPIIDRPMTGPVAQTVQAATATVPAAYDTLLSSYTFGPFTLAWSYSAYSTKFVLTTNQTADGGNFYSAFALSYDQKMVSDKPFRLVMLL